MCVCVCVCVCVYAHNMQEGSHAQLILQSVMTAAQGDMHSTVDRICFEGLNGFLSAVDRRGWQH